MTRRWLWVGTLFASVTAAGPLAVNVSSTGASIAPVVVPVTVVGGQGALGGAEPMVKVRVGVSKPVPVFLDTGSSGLHIFANAVNTNPGSGVTVTSQTSNIAFLGGVKFAGVVGSAVVKLGPQATAGPVPFTLVNEASCKASKPSCAAANGINAYESSTGAYGVLGIGTRSSEGNVISPILGMPGDLSDTWSLRLSGTTGALVLGAPTSRAKPAVTTFQMKSMGTVGDKTLWADSSLPFCVAVGQTQECVPGLFDSGTASFQVSGPVLGHVPTNPGSRTVVSGLAVDVAQLGAAAPFWTFTTGTAKSEDLVRLGPQPHPFVNTGVQAFYDFTIVYDDLTGTVSLYQ
jgi:Protein of unknown function (DUF3443)